MDQWHHPEFNEWEPHPGPQTLLDERRRGSRWRNNRRWLWWLTRGCFFNKASLTEASWPEIVTVASKDNGKLSALSSIKWLAARSFPCIIKSAKQRATWPEVGAVETWDGRWDWIEQHSTNKVFKSPSVQHLNRLSNTLASSLDIDLKWGFCSKRIGNIAALRAIPSNEEQSA